MNSMKKQLLLREANVQGSTYSKRHAFHNKISELHTYKEISFVILYLSDLGGAMLLVLPSGTLNTGCEANGSFVGIV